MLPNGRIVNTRDLSLANMGMESIYQGAAISICSDNRVKKLPVPDDTPILAIRQEPSWRRDGFEILAKLPATGFPRLIFYKPMLCLAANTNLLAVSNKKVGCMCGFRSIKSAPLNLGAKRNFIYGIPSERSKDEEGDFNFRIPFACAQRDLRVLKRSSDVIGKRVFHAFLPRTAIHICCG